MYVGVVSNLLLLHRCGRQLELLHGPLHSPADVATHLGGSLAQGSGHWRNLLAQMLDLEKGTCVQYCSAYGNFRDVVRLAAGCK